PVIFMKGVIGAYFYQYGITVTAAVLLSLLEALTLTPMRCSRFLRIAPPKGLNWVVENIFHYCARVYQNILRFILTKPIVIASVLIVTSAFFAGSLYLAKLLPSEMIPAQDQSNFVIRVKGPVGSALPLTDSKIRIAEEWL